jgi:hypothetical protein
MLDSRFFITSKYPVIDDFTANVVIKDDTAGISSLANNLKKQNEDLENDVLNEDVAILFDTGEKNMDIIVEAIEGIDKISINMKKLIVSMIVVIDLIAREIDPSIPDEVYDDGTFKPSFRFKDLDDFDNFLDGLISELVHREIFTGISG